MTALGNITIGDDELSDEDDFMDEDEDEAERRRQERAQKRVPQHKYRDMMQKLADRTIEEATIDLDDLALVGSGQFRMGIRSLTSH